MAREQMFEAGSGLERAFSVWLKTTDLPTPDREYGFDPDRRWRFDFAWPQYSVAVEVEGLVYGGKGRHQTKQGFEGDAEKYEAAMLQGWTVYRIPGSWIRIGRRIGSRSQVILALAKILRRGGWEGPAIQA